VLTVLTGSGYFPGGMGRFEIPEDGFLLFEHGPAVDLTLQRATYRDASDRTGQSRIWAGFICRQTTSRDAISAR
jgi:hypothetical protein